MPWPTVTDYNEAIQNLRATTADEELRNGVVARAGRLPAKWPGNFAIVYQVKCEETGNTWAVKCFTRKTPHRQERYRAISDCLQQTHLRSAVGFQYLEQGIQVHGEWFPALKMKWVEGKPLNEFIEEHVEDQRILRQFLQLWPQLARELQGAGIAHADLQHGNVLLVPREDGRYSLKLVDYDGMFLPALAGTPSGESGHRNYQHPRRAEEQIYSGDVDRFSHLVIFSAVRSLAAGRADLWQEFNDGENLLFRESDFASPRESQVFRTLWHSEDKSVRALAGRLVLSCEQPLAATPLLDDILDSDGRVQPLGKVLETAVSRILGEVTAFPSSSPGSVVGPKHTSGEQLPGTPGPVLPPPLPPLGPPLPPSLPRAVPLAGSATPPPRGYPAQDSQTRGAAGSRQEPLWAAEIVDEPVVASGFEEPLLVAEVVDEPVLAEIVEEPLLAEIVEEPLVAEIVEDAAPPRAAGFDPRRRR